MAELLVVIAIIGITLGLALPLIYNYFTSANLVAGAEELSAILMNARQLAIQQNTTICVTNNGTSVQFHVSTCAAAAWTGPGTDSSGFIALSHPVTVSGATNAQFDYMGRATTAGTYTVTNPTDGKTMSVIVATTGRVRIGP